MRKGLFFTLAAVLVGMGFLFSTAQAVTYNSGFQVKNMSDTTAANINIRYIDQAGTEVTTHADSIAAGGSKTYYPIHPTTAFNGSVVIESDQPISAIANTLGDGTQYGASTNGFTSGATTINLPLLMRQNSGFSTWFNVQNTGSVAANVNVTYSNGATEPPASIPPGAAKTYDQAGNTSLIPPFVGSGVVTSDQPIVATVMQVGSGGTKVLLGYNSFTTNGSTTVQLPLVQALNAGFFTGIQVMNTGAVPTDITIAYGANTVGAATPAPDICTGVLPNQSCTKLTSGGPWTYRYIGGAQVTNSAGQPLVAIVNQLNTGSGKGTAYEGFDPTGATATAVAPLIMAQNSGYFTGVQVQNVGTGNCDITVQYSTNTVSSAIVNPANETASGLAPGSSATFLQNGGQWTARYVGGATITGSGAGCLVAAIVNELASVAGDQFFTYNTTSK